MLPWLSGLYVRTEKNIHVSSLGPTRTPSWYGRPSPHGWGLLRTPTLSQRLLADVPGAHLLLLAKQAADGGLDALFLGGLVERVLATVTAAGVAHRAVLGACRASGTEEDL